jgi:hypothetical protein
MGETMQFSIGAEIVCSDGVCGDLIRIVVDPIARSVTHLVVEPKHRQGPSRLVPLDLVEPTRGKIEIRCTQEGFDKLDPAEETEFLPGSYGDYGSGQVLYQPYYGLGMGAMGGMGVGGLAGSFMQPVTHDTVPLGEVSLRRGEHVHATDGDIGKIQGLVIDRRNNHVAHVLLQEGHLWGQKQVVIPINAVTNIDDGGAHLNLTKEEVRDLPPVDIDDHD